MMEQQAITVAISSDFLSAFAALPRKIQGKVTDFINKFRNNPKAPGINYEKIHAAIDNKICSVRIDDTYRGIVVRQEEKGVYLLLWVDHHDEAYEWASRKKCEVNKLTGNVQVFDVSKEILEESAIQNALFSAVDNDSLIKFGVPEELLPFIRSLKTTDDFYKAKSSFPSDVYEVLEYLANGISVAEVEELFSSVQTEKSKDEDLAVALQTDVSKTSFVVIEGEEELRRIMAEPLEKWRVFLHPTQRRLVSKNFSGPYRVLGGAGTGKTVVAMHRAKWLASNIAGKERVLFTTFTANLAGDIKDNLRKICSLEELRRIDVIHLDAWVGQFLREHGYTYNVVYDDVTDEIWEEAIARSGEVTGLGVNFFSEEWSKVVAAQESFSLELYLKASRLGRGTKLDRKKRMQVWNVFDEYLSLMKEKQVRDVDTAMYECRLILEKNNQTASAYASVIVDEGQDFSSNAYRLLRSIAGDERPNDLFIVGDAHQRIYKKKTVLSKCGINVRGRSSTLRVNYRTTEEIRKYAFAFLKGISFDNLDDEYESEDHCRSLTHGDYPEIKNFKSASDEHVFIVEEINRLASTGINLKDICLVSRTHSLVNEYIKMLREAGIRVYEIKREKLDDRSFDGVRVATMHRVKGLEFPYMFVAAANKRVIPYAKAIDETDPASALESMTSEKCLLYVALTRAQKAAYITNYGTPSEFLQTIIPEAP
jgi:superfamily I DNA/RNA helicase/mRNA-degrading endonuclease RelE of RelBE toxin-antitoxin system